ncbi:MAG: hypothetical protein ABIJ16_03785 [Bacteroidota bacterium]
MKKLFENIPVFLCVLLLSGMPDLITAQPETGEKLVSMMYERYHTSWFRQVSFTQTANFYSNDTLVKSETWYEAYRFPGMLLIKFNDLKGGDGMLFRNDSVYSFKNGEISTAGKRIHDLILLSLDIYLQDPETSLAKIREQGYDPGKLSMGKYRGKDIYIVGDSLTNCFWIDAENLLFLKMHKKTEKGLEEVLFDGYIRSGGGWIEQEVYFYLDGKLRMDEKYENISTGFNAGEDWFLPGNFSRASW